MTSNRVSRRVAVKAAVSLKFSAMSRVHGWIHDISITGIHVQTDEVITIGAKCEVCIILREGNERRRVFIDAKVVRRDDKGTALVFQNMPDATHRELSELLLNSLSTPVG